jgi:hypothetical protein
MVRRLIFGQRRIAIVTRFIKAVLLDMTRSLESAYVELLRSSIG